MMFIPFFSFVIAILLVPRSLALRLVSTYQTIGNELSKRETHSTLPNNQHANTLGRGYYFRSLSLLLPFGRLTKIYPWHSSILFLPTRAKKIQFVIFPFLLINLT